MMYLSARQWLRRWRRQYRRPNPARLLHHRTSVERCRFEPLETRWMLSVTVDAGLDLSVPLGQPLDLTAIFVETMLGQDHVAQIDWGDSTSPSLGSITPPAASQSDLFATIDYSFDTNHFFDTQAKRDLLQFAADSLVSRFGDELSAIVPAGVNTWTAMFPHPGTGEEAQVQDRQIAANEIVIYAGGRPLSALGQGGPGGSSVSGTGGAFFLDVLHRGEIGSDLNPPTDFARWGGAITFDTNTNWHMDYTTQDLNPGESDFLSVAVHELTHLFGIGTAPSWDALIQNHTFVGPQATMLYDGQGSPPVASDGAHWLDGTTDEGQETAMDPTLTVGTRKLLTELDFAALDDIGWDLLPAGGQGGISASHMFDRVGSFPVTITVTNQLGQTSSDTLTVNVTAREDASIGDTVFNDLNGNGQQDEQEPLIAGLVVSLIAAGNDGVIDTNDDVIYDSQFTDSQSGYDFTSLPPGMYRVDLSYANLPGDWALTTDNDLLLVDLAESQDFNAADFGLRQLQPDVTITVNDQTITPNQTQPVDFGIVDRGQVGATVTFTVANPGQGTLNISSLSLPDGFVAIDPLDTTIAAGESDTFSVQLLTSSAGSFQGNIRITSDDPDSPAFEFPVAGQVESPNQELTFDAGNRLARFTAADGVTQVTIRLAGPGQGTLILPPSGQGDPIAIEMLDTTERSRLIIRTTGNAPINIDRITLAAGNTGPGALAALVAPSTNLQTSLTSDDVIRSINLGDVLPGETTIDLGGNIDSAPAACRFGSITDLTMTTAGPVRMLRAVDWTSSNDTPELLQAPAVLSLITTGNSSSDGNADLDLLLSGESDMPVSLRVARIAGRASGTWHILGGANNLFAGTTDSQWSLDSDHTRNIRILGDAAGQITTQALANLIVLGSMNAATVTVTAPIDINRPAATSLNRLVVRETVSASTFNVAGNVGSVVVGRFINSHLRIGVAAQVMGLPAQASDFDALAQIRSFVARGLPGGSDPTFAGSNLAASRITRAILGNLDTNNQGTPFGLAYLDTPARIVFNDGQGNQVINRTTDPADLRLAGDFDVIQII